MRGFFKIMFASLAAIVVTLAVLFFMGVKLVDKATAPDKPELKPKTVLVIDISKPVQDQHRESGISLPNGRSAEIMGLFDMVRAIKQAESDSMVKGIYLQCRRNQLGLASGTELRDALLSFKKTGKFIIAASDYISEAAFNVACVADSIFCQPGAGLDWQGLSMELTFFKKALDKLEVKPEVFFAGQFKSATEPFRFEKMSEPNRLQLTEFLEDIYQQELRNIGTQRKKDTAVLRQLSNDYSIRTSYAAVRSGLIDGERYDDEVKDGIRAKLGLKTDDKINFMPMADYIKNGNWEKTHSEKIALLYAEGEIVTGNGEEGAIGGDKFRNLLRKVRLDKEVKAVVLRVNSPGGSSVACETMWREIELIKKEKPVVVSMGDYAASGGYYMACNADSIFAQPNTLTGSIGVYMLYFNTQLLFNKLGITFDGVKTGQHADFGSASRPMTEKERIMAQNDTDSTYLLFKTRVANGRKLSLSFVDSVAQGRIWSGQKAVGIGLVDRIGGLQDAINCAAGMAKLKEYELQELPLVETFWKKVLGGGDGEDEKAKSSLQAADFEEQVGSEGVDLLKQYKSLKSWVGVPQMRLPFFASFK